MIKFTKDLERASNDEYKWSLHIGTGKNTKFGIKLFIDGTKNHHFWYFRWTEMQKRVYYGHVSTEIT